MNAHAKNQPKDVDSITQTRFIMIALRLAPACALLGWALSLYREIVGYERSQNKRFLN
jgi:hypothetical protein